MADSKISNLPAVVTPGLSDVLPIVNSGATKKITVNNLLAAASSAVLPSIRLFNNNNVGQSTFYGLGGDTTNSIDYVMFMNTVEYATNTSVLDSNLSNVNVIVKTTGKYLVSSSVNFFNIVSPTGFIRLRLYGSTSPIVPTPGTGAYPGTGTLLATFDQGYQFVGISGDGGKRGSTFINVTSVPYYLAALFLHSGGSGAPGGNGAFLSGNNNTGYQPELEVLRLTS